jgi:hypothetical protein
MKSPILFLAFLLLLPLSLRAQEGAMFDARSALLIDHVADVYNAAGYPGDTHFFRVALLP